jgi:serine protease Do
MPAPTTQPIVWMGVYLEDAADGGVQVLGLVPGGPADRSGMQAGDVVLGVGSLSVLDLEALNQTLLTMKPGQRAELRILRDGSVQTVPLLLGDRSKVKPAMEPMPAPAPRTLTRKSRDTLGLEVVDIPEELRKHYGAPADAGALVVKLEADGPAARAGLRVGDVVVRAGERPVQGPADVLVGLMTASGNEVPLQVVRSRRDVTVTVPRPAVPRRVTVNANDARILELTAEVDRLRARVAELEAELEKARHE